MADEQSLPRAENSAQEHNRLGPPDHIAHSMIDVTRRMRRALSPWVQRWVQPAGEVEEIAHRPALHLTGIRPTALTERNTAAVAGRIQRTVAKSSTVPLLPGPTGVDRFATGVADRFPQIASKYEAKPLGAQATIQRSELPLVEDTVAPEVEPVGNVEETSTLESPSAITTIGVPPPLSQSSDSLWLTAQLRARIPRARHVQTPAAAPEDIQPVMPPSSPAITTSPEGAQVRRFPQPEEQPSESKGAGEPAASPTFAEIRARIEAAKAKSVTGELAESTRRPPAVQRSVERAGRPSQPGRSAPPLTGSSTEGPDSTPASTHALSVTSPRPARPRSARVEELPTIQRQVEPTRPEPPTPTSVAASDTIEPSVQSSPSMIQRSPEPASQADTPLEASSGEDAQSPAPIEASAGSPTLPPTSEAEPVEPAAHVSPSIIQRSSERRDQGRAQGRDLADPSKQNRTTAPQHRPASLTRGQPESIHRTTATKPVSEGAESTEATTPATAMGEQSESIQRAALDAHVVQSSAPSQAPQPVVQRKIDSTPITEGRVSPPESGELDELVESPASAEPIEPSAEQQPPTIHRQREDLPLRLPHRRDVPGARSSQPPAATKPETLRSPGTHHLATTSDRPEVSTAQPSASIQRQVEERPNVGPELVGASAIPTGAEPSEPQAKAQSSQTTISRASAQTIRRQIDEGVTEGGADNAPVAAQSGELHVQPAVRTTILPQARIQRFPDESSVDTRRAQTPANHLHAALPLALPRTVPIRAFREPPSASQAATTIQRKAEPAPIVRVSSAPESIQREGESAPSSSPPAQSNMERAQAEPLSGALARGKARSSDVQDLARKIYPLIRRMLAIERERR